MKTRAMLACAVVAVLAIAPGPASAGGRPAAELPGVSVLVRILRPQAPAPAQQHAAAKPAEAVAAPKPAKGVVDVPDAIAPAADLVRVTTVDYAHNNPAAELDLGGPCPRPSTCGVYQLAQERRRADKTGRVVIPYTFNNDGKRALRAPDDDIVRSALLHAMAEWSHWNSNIVFQDVGETTATFGAEGKDGSCSDGVNVITWGRFSSDILGAAATCLDRNTHTIRDTDLALNIFQRWTDGIDERRPSYDLQSIFAHELGHWLSLMHPDQFQGARQTMFASANPNETFKRTLALGDIKGIQAAYPCAAGDSCPRTGIRDD